MRRSRLSVEQIVAVLKQVKAGMTVADACRRMGISEQTFYRWQKQYGSLQPDQARESSSRCRKRMRGSSSWSQSSDCTSDASGHLSKKWSGPR